ncbi:MAG: PilZ domain-containing protein [Dethiobacter sp.]|jgi:c-di-GMP-binding flagellar brake protein YcgR|nr:PilZ domain-containing protein [Dethiobacter sp.]
MSKKHYFYINQNLQIAVAGDDFFYKTIIHDLSENIIYVTVPTFKGSPFMPQKGEMVDGIFFEGSAMFFFTTAVLGLRAENGFYLLMLQKPLSLTRKQRRNYYRHPAVLDIEFQLVIDAKDKENNSLPVPWCKAKTLDIGGGGIKFTCDTRLDRGTALKLKIFIGEKSDKEPVIVTAGGKVVRVVPSPVKAGSYNYGLSFTAIEEKQRDRIINYIFNLSRKRIL